MMNFRKIALALLALTAVSCASPAKLSQKSRDSLSEGKAQDAYDDASRALEKDPSFGPAREALAAAATALVRQRQSGIKAAAQGGDTLLAGQRILGLDHFRREVTVKGVPLSPDTTFEDMEDRLRNGAAAIHYRRGVHEQLDGSPRLAYQDFVATHELVPGFRDVESRVDKTLQLSIMRVAILPFADETALEGLARDVADDTYSELTRRVTRADFQFTQLVERSEVNNRLTVAELDRMSLSDALKVGRDLGAQVVVIGRLYGLRTDGHVDRYRDPIYRRVTERDDKTGETQTRYEENQMNYVVRERTLSLSWEAQLVDVASGRILSTHSMPVSARARTAFTEFMPSGEVDDYSLYTPDMSKATPQATKKREEDYKTRLGAVKLKEFLGKAKKQEDRHAYKPSYRHEFYSDTWERPDFLGELPPDKELAVIAIGEIWKPVLAELETLDKRR